MFTAALDVDLHFQLSRKIIVVCQVCQVSSCFFAFYVSITVVDMIEAVAVGF